MDRSRHRLYRTCRADHPHPVPGETGGQNTPAHADRQDGVEGAPLHARRVWDILDLHWTVG
jgi:hypothetical protein